ncbi:VanZ family protein [Arthrobacter sp. NtRootA1]|uniref:VanZ family protein n=1 Tax=Arthrobacter sp. NtRootA1 TaxID=2830983 RepID=UPI001CC3ED23|nr:VanZ family protein [Arthrobacter sp. NtRootA1]
MQLKNTLPWRIALVAYLGSLGVIGFWPTPVDQPIQGTLATVLNFLHRHGVPHWFDYHVVESSANVAMFIPLGIFAAMAFPTRAWWVLTGLGILVSTCMELGQLLFITARFSSVVDVVMNTLGTVIGVAAMQLLARRRRTKFASPQGTS